MSTLLLMLACVEPVTSEDSGPDGPESVLSVRVSLDPDDSLDGMVEAVVRGVGPNGLDEVRWSALDGSPSMLPIPLRVEVSDPEPDWSYLLTVSGTFGGVAFGAPPIDVGPADDATLEDYDWGTIDVLLEPEAR